MYYQNAGAGVNLVCVCNSQFNGRVLGLEESSVWNIYLRQEVAGNLDTFYLIFFYLACLLESISFDGRPWYSGVFDISTRKLKNKKEIMQDNIAYQMNFLRQWKHLTAM